MKKKSILVLLMASMLAAEPAQIISAQSVAGAESLTDTIAVPDTVQNEIQDTSLVKVTPKWVAVKKGYQWRQSDGTFLRKTGWVTLKGKKYYLQKGIRYVGWQSYKGKKRFYLSNGALAQNRWVKYKGNYYYIRGNGTSASPNKWITVNGKKYYINKKGYRVTGFRKIQNKKYYFDSKGVLVQDRSSYMINGQEYEIDSQGVAIRVSALKSECLNKARQFVEKHTSPDMSNSQKFRTCFNYLMAYTDFKPWIYPTDAQFKTQIWPYQSAIYMFDNGLSGSCYGVASAVAACARVLGYEPYVIATTGDHGFVMIDGLYYDNMGPLFGASAHFAYSVRSRVKF